MMRLPAFLPLLLLVPWMRASGDYRDVLGPVLPGDRLLAEYFERETARLEGETLAGIEGDWEAARAGYRVQLADMLGLNPLPERTALSPVVTGLRESGEIVVENVVFQSRPGLYVTGNLYRPKTVGKPLPAVLYVCGHAAEKEGDVSFGNNAHYGFHGAWFARNGYVCLVIDTLQLGEIEGIHHGTYRYERWWWQSRGYTPAGVEAWNSMRALDYLESRPEVDKSRMGVTGRSGGGAYSWWLAALDERIKVAVPVAGIASLRNHVVDGCVEGHCDCMFHVNTYRWDFPMIAALVAPRPLLIVNTDKDPIFPLDGVVDVYNKARKIYRLLGAEEKIGIALYEGPHSDTQPLRVDAFHWFERFLKGRGAEEEIADTTAPAMFAREDLRVFGALPEDAVHTRIDETFVPAAPAPEPPQNAEAWAGMSGEAMRRLRAEAFRGWPESGGALDLEVAVSVAGDGIHLTRFEFASQSPYRLSLWLAHREGLKASELDLVVLHALDETGWEGFLGRLGAAIPGAFEGLALPPLDAAAYAEEKALHADRKWGMAFVAPRGIGATAWTADPKERTQVLRRFALLGQTLDGMRVWDVRRGIQALRAADGMAGVPLWLQGSGAMAGNVLYASLFEEGIARLDLHALPTSHREGPTYLNVLRILDLPQAVAMAAGRSTVVVYTNDGGAWDFAGATAERLGWEPKRFRIREPLPAEGD